MLTELVTCPAMTRYEGLSLTLAVLGLIISTVVLVLLLLQLRLLARQVADSREALDLSTKESEAENRRRQQRATIDFIAYTIAKSQEMYDLIPVAGSRLVDQFRESAVVRDSPAFRALRNYLNYFESISVAVNLEIFDIEVVNRSIGGRIVRTWDLYEDWILSERVSLATPAIDNDFERCAATLRDMRLQS